MSHTHLWHTHIWPTDLQTSLCHQQKFPPEHNCGHNKSHYWKNSESGRTPPCKYIHQVCTASNIMLQHKLLWYLMGNQILCTTGVTMGYNKNPYSPSLSPPRPSSHPGQRQSGRGNPSCWCRQTHSLSCRVPSPCPTGNDRVKLLLTSSVINISYKRVTITNAMLHE